ncbi:MAG: acyl-CoA dehydrogenase [Chlorobi bacterium]|nr:MAG: acyl-CoA dehydrogenase [Bacteroidota bacterium]KXK34687.1 MAG: acyl-CoA dehydrogenase [Chlorobi bacterium OLB6]MBL1160989.1 acyl-CoA dehydrogenase [Chlorobiota bacterium]MBW7852947.1 acyl-CoA dehydrogenase family protein [Candidatus Kapabacteria bacterium]MCC6330801.1 acyl-CoA dehydrogenase family protein [Ignavibacteria bacterium]
MSTDTLYSMEISADQQALREHIRSFIETNLKPVVGALDETQEFPAEIFRQLGDLGYLGIVFPAEYGGTGLGYLEYAIAVEEVARVCPAVALGVAAHNGLCTSHIYRFASEELKQMYVPNLASGTWLGAWGLTEPNAGSDAGGTQTRATKDGGSWVINGSKNFITHGNVGHVCVVMAMTDPSRGKNGISAFVVDKTMPGFYGSKKENKLGMRCSDTASLTFDNVVVPSSHMIGNEGEGFRQALQILDGGRISIAALSVGLAQGAFEAATAYAKERMQFGKRLADMQAIQFKLARMSMEIDAARMLTYKAAWLRDQKQPFSREASQAKLYASETAVRTAEDAVQIHGGYGYVKDYPVEKFWRDSKLLTIGEGTSEIQKMVIARSLLSD